MKINTIILLIILVLQAMWFGVHYEKMNAQKETLQFLKDNYEIQH